MVEENFPEQAAPARSTSVTDMPAASSAPRSASVTDMPSLGGRRLIHKTKPEQEPPAFAYKAPPASPAAKPEEHYTYDDDDGSLTQMRAASQDFLNYSYDSLKRLTGINRGATQRA